jgi:tripartite-type tricarboxylate transporter receptor subunit TctC
MPAGHAAREEEDAQAQALLTRESPREEASMRTVRLIAIGFAMLLAAIAGPVQAKDYPERPVRIIVTYPPGGAADVIARIFAQKLSEGIGGQFYVENLAGASGATGTAAAASAAPDGHTIVFVSPDLVVSPLLKAKVPYDPFSSFAPVTLVVSSREIVAAHPSLGANSMKELIALLKTNPGKYGYATPGYGSLPHLKGERLFRLSYGLDVTHVPFQGFAPAVSSTLAGHTSILVGTPMSLVAAHIKEGKLRGLAIDGNKRAPGLPDVPTLAEAEAPDLGNAAWFGALAPAGTPRDTVALLQREIRKIMSLPEVAERLATLGFEPVGNTPDEFAAWIKSESGYWEKVVRESRLKIE